jgi:xanthine dehydrogenase accessory factor
MPFVEVRVLETRGSAPREAGTCMWVGPGASQGDFVTRGTIGGGNLEYTALKIAREMLLSGEARRERRFALGDALGQCCGGSVTLGFSLKEAIAEDLPATFPSVILFGAGHVGKEVARILERLPVSLTWADPRPEQFPGEAKAKVVIEEDPGWVVDEAPAGAFYLVMTHSHALDLEIVERILRRRDYRFLGLIGSETKAAKFRARLSARGLDCGDLVCPVGLFKAGKHPAEVAVSAVAQLLSVIATETSDRAAPAPLRSAP